jgi:Uncharacterized conserved protein
MDEMVKKYLFDIQQSLVSIETFIGDKKDFSAYMQNKMLRRAVEREFEIMGEAMNKLDKVDPAIPISSKKQIIGLRNRVIHGYDKIDDEICLGYHRSSSAKIKVGGQQTIK